MAFWYKNKDQNIVIRVRVVPNSYLRIIQINEGFIKIGVVSIPEKGKANAELIKFLSKKLNLPKKNFSIIKGDTAKNKEIEIIGLHSVEVFYDNWRQKNCSRSIRKHSTNH